MMQSNRAVKVGNSVSINDQCQFPSFADEWALHQQMTVPITVTSRNQEILAAKYVPVLEWTVSTVTRTSHSYGDISITPDQIVKVR